MSLVSADGLSGRRGARLPRRGVPRPTRAAVEARRALVAVRLLARRPIREIARELAALPEGERPVDCSRSTIARDALAIRAEWARARVDAMDQILGEDLARLAALEAEVYPRALTGDPAAVDRVLAIQRQRWQLLALAPRPGLVPGVPGVPGVSVGVGVAVGSDAGSVSGSAPALRVTVEYVDDWREARTEYAGALELLSPSPSPSPPSPSGAGERE